MVVTFLKDTPGQGKNSGQLLTTKTKLRPLGQVFLKKKKLEGGLIDVAIVKWSHVSYLNGRLSQTL